MELLIHKILKNVNKSSGGTLRRKIECVTGWNSIVAIDYIKSNLSAKFIDDIQFDKLKFIEEVAIWAYQPKLNAVKESSSFFNNICYQ